MIKRPRICKFLFKRIVTLAAFLPLILAFNNCGRGFDTTSGQSSAASTQQGAGSNVGTPSTTTTVRSGVTTTTLRQATTTTQPSYSVTTTLPASTTTLKATTTTTIKVTTTTLQATTTTIPSVPRIENPEEMRFDPKAYPSTAAMIDHQVSILKQYHREKLNSEIAADILLPYKNRLLNGEAWRMVALSFSNYVHREIISCPSAEITWEGANGEVCTAVTPRGGPGTNMIIYAKSVTYRGKVYLAGRGGFTTATTYAIIDCPVYKWGFTDPDAYFAKTGYQSLKCGLYKDGSQYK